MKDIQLRNPAARICNFFFFFFHRLHSDLHVEFLCFVFVWTFGLWVGGLVWFGLGFFVNFVLWGFLVGFLPCLRMKLTTFRERLEHIGFFVSVSRLLSL